MFALLLPAILIGCAHLNLAEETGALPPSTHLADVPFYPQTEFHCGPAALATMLAHQGVAVDYEELVERVYLPERQGSLQAELTATARSLGRIPYRLEANIGAVLAELAAGRPVLVLENHGLSRYPYWHYAVVIGYDQTSNRLLLRSGNERELSIRAGAWFRQWDRAGRWAVVLVEPGQWPADADRERWLNAAVDFEAVAEDDAALAVWEQTLERWPDAALAWLGLGNVQFRRGRLEAAVDAYQRLLEIHPDHASGRYNLAVALQRNGRPCQARSELKALRADATLGQRVTRRIRQLDNECQHNVK
ncbi:PA2778 family cysteine peptidase [Wenzhouxiangella sp. AB-CW3]|uniref:PA2778 family cysteine peptidase n=1 Tax=Wenzhouxiangella sp. AB-CW3 TaxID=2771012 RepID=UPI00168B94B1|nr:PA2778 family cysteine peptidase [Wenzhouxiangella sp. AB-CW3]QOC22660.1 PA2778 family cysteine peptidase [Wenzhouxiangella sp. AB-CW3]